MTDGTTCGPFSLASDPQGPRGPAGAITSMDLSTVICGTSANSNAIALFGLTDSDPPTQAEMRSSRISWMN